MAPQIEASPAKNETYNGGHAIKAPATPPLPPADLLPPPLRYPETLHTLIEICEAEGKGKGVFALVDIEPGTVLLSEAPLVTLIDTGTRADPLDASIAALPPAQRASYLSLHHFSRNPHESLHRSILYSNGYSIMSDLGTGIFETASRINHSCVPNSAYVWKETAGRMVFWNRFKLLKGEEVCVDYGHRKGQLERIYGFECNCGGCTETGSEGLSSPFSEMSLENKAKGEEVQDRKVEGGKVTGGGVGESRESAEKGV